GRPQRPRLRLVRQHLRRFHRGVQGSSRPAVGALPPSNLLSIALREMTLRGTAVASFTDGEAVWETRAIPNGFQVVRVLGRPPLDEAAFEDEPLPFPAP